MGKKLAKASQKVRKHSAVPGAEVLADVIDILDDWRKSKNPARGGRALDAPDVTDAPISSKKRG